MYAARTRNGLTPVAREQLFRYENAVFAIEIHYRPVLFALLNMSHFWDS
jgi:hypothetical protein